MRVPAGHVDRGLGRRMSGENAVHGVLNAVVAARVEADHGRRQQSERASYTFAMRGDIGASKRRALAPADGSVIAMEGDNGGIERPVFAPARQTVDAAGIGKVGPVRLYPRDFHEYTMTASPRLSRSGSTPRPGASPGLQPPFSAQGPPIPVLRVL